MNHAIDCGCREGFHDPRCTYLRVMQPKQVEPRKRGSVISGQEKPAHMVPVVDPLKIDPRGNPWE
jgi:hypothetical protein